MVTAVARVDALAKGLTAGNPWEDLVALALAVCGTPSRRSAASLSTRV